MNVSINQLLTLPGSYTLLVIDPYAPHPLIGYTIKPFCPLSTLHATITRHAAHAVLVKQSSHVQTSSV